MDNNDKLTPDNTTPAQPDVPQPPVQPAPPVQQEQPAQPTPPQNQPQVPPPPPGAALNTSQSMGAGFVPNAQPAPTGPTQGAYLPSAMNIKKVGQESYHESMEQKAHTMRDVLRQQPKVWAMIPLQPGEKPGTMLPVGINGYFIYIKKGVMVQVPQQVGEMLSYSFNLDYENGADLDLARNEDKQRALS